MNANYAYAQVVHMDPLLVTLRRHEWDHAAALATELAAVGLGTPRPPHAISDLDATSERVARAGGRPEVLSAAAALEDELVDALPRRARRAPRRQDRDDRRAPSWPRTPSIGSCSRVKMVPIR